MVQEGLVSGCVLRLYFAMYNIYSISLFLWGDFSFTKCHLVSWASYSLLRTKVPVHAWLRSQAAGGAAASFPCDQYYMSFLLLAAISTCCLTVRFWTVATEKEEHEAYTIICCVWTTTWISKLLIDGLWWAKTNKRKFTEVRNTMKCKYFEKD